MGLFNSANEIDSEVCHIVCTCVCGTGIQRENVLCQQKKKLKFKIRKIQFDSIVLKPFISIKRPAHASDRKHQKTFVEN